MGIGGDGMGIITDSVLGWCSETFGDCPLLLLSAVSQREKTFVHRTEYHTPMKAVRTEEGKVRKKVGADGN